jgi:hypothetical protein
MSSRNPKRRAGGLTKVQLRIGAVTFALESPGWAMTTVELGLQRLAATRCTRAPDVYASGRRLAKELRRQGKLRQRQTEARRTSTSAWS